MKRVVILMLCAMLLMSGCGGTDDLITAEVIQVNTAQNAPGYVPGEDCQQQWNTWSITVGKMSTEGEGGYYFYDDSAARLLYFHDYATGRTVPVCNRPDCDHTDDCSAKLDFGMNYLHYYDGMLYTLNSIGNDVILQRISPDGATKDVVGRVFSMSNSGSVMAAFHRGYVYCVPTGQGLVNHQTELYRMYLGGGKEAEVIHKFDSVLGGEAFIRAYGNYLYIQHQFYADKDASGYNANLWQYDIHTGEMELILEGMRRMFAVDDEHLYYDSDTQVIARNLETGEETVLLEPGVPVVLTYDGTWLYCDDLMGLEITDAPLDVERTITIIDTDTLQIAGSVNWERDTKYRFIGVADDTLLGACCFTQDSAFYICDLETVLSGGKGVWQKIV